MIAENTEIFFEQLPPAILRRIEQLGRMNDRRMQYLVSCNKTEMLKLADEYEKRRMPMMAAEVRKEARDL